MYVDKLMILWVVSRALFMPSFIELLSRTWIPWAQWLLLRVGLYSTYISSIQRERRLGSSSSASGVVGRSSGSKLFQRHLSSNCDSLDSSSPISSPQHSKMGVVVTSSRQAHRRYRFTSASQRISCVSLLHKLSKKRERAMIATTCKGHSITLIKNGERGEKCLWNLVLMFVRTPSYSTLIPPTYVDLRVGKMFLRVLCFIGRKKKTF